MAIAVLETDARRDEGRGAGAPARLMCTVPPSGLERYFAEFSDPVPTCTSPAPSLSDAEREERVRRAVAVAPEYGMKFVLPPEP